MSKIRLARVSTFYDDYLTQFYSKNIGLGNMAYSEQYKKLMGDCFSWSDFWKINLEKSGQFVVEELVVNIPQLQKQWAKEHNINYDESDWISKIMIAQLNDFNPEVLFVDDLFTITPHRLSQIKKQVSSIKCFIAYHCMSVEDFNVFSGYDLVFACCNWLIKELTHRKIPCELLHHGFETSILGKLKKSATNYDLSFVGCLFKRMHDKRYELIKELSRKTNIAIWSSTIKPTEYSFSGLLKLGFNGIQSLLNGRGSSFIDDTFFNPVLKKLQGEAMGLAMYNIFHNSKMTINYHHEASQNDAGNMRLFEATGSGTLLLTDKKDNIGDIFEIDKEIIVYDSVEDLLEKINYYLIHEEARKNIAAAGQKRTIEQYSFEKLTQKFSQKIAPYL